MWKYMIYQDSGGYSIAAINVVYYIVYLPYMCMYMNNFIVLPTLTSNFI